MVTDVVAEGTLPVFHVLPLLQFPVLMVTAILILIAIITINDCYLFLNSG